MLDAIIQAVAIAGLTWFIWQAIRIFALKSPLDNIPGPESRSFLYGNLRDLTALDSWPYHDHLVENYPGFARLRGPFGGRVLYVFDPSALHQILVKDQYIYEEAQYFIRSFAIMVGQGLLSTLGEHHRKQRKMLNPVFSPRHMRHMIPTFYGIGQSLLDALDAKIQAGADELDMALWTGRAALEIIGQAGLGYSFDPLVNEKPDDFATALKTVTYALGRATIPRRILPYLPTIRFAGIGHALLKVFPNDGVRALVHISDIIWASSMAIYTEKKHALAQGDEAVSRQVGEGKDIMSILLRANLEASAEDRLDEDELLGQMSTLTLAAVDTTSNALCGILARLAEHPDVQQKLREEILRSGADKELDFDALMAPPYLEAVCRETLRLLFAPQPQPCSPRFCRTRQDVVLPLSKPIRGVDGTPIHAISVPKNTTVVCGLLNCNRNKALWGADADEWKPERWLAPLPSTVTEAKIPGVYSNLMTFLGGGRACIGFKFSQLEMKVLLSLLLSKFTFGLCDEPVVWKFGGVRFPTVGKDCVKPYLPMKVKLYKANESTRPEASP
ncbi:cytochrome P450 [Trametes elegans]|nr:cytochrome P450 [Trametes elegans]